LLSPFRCTAAECPITGVTVGHVFRIIHEHTSAPIGFNDSKAILQRPNPS